MERAIRTARQQYGEPWMGRALIETARRDQGKAR